MPGSNSPSTKDGGAESEDASSLFIHFTGEDGNDTSTQRSIRSHVMRNCHRKKRENRVRFLSRAANGQRLPTLTARVLARRNKSLQPQEASVLMSTAPTSPEETTTISAPIKPITTKKVPLTNAITSPPSDSTFISQIDGLDPFSTLPIKPTPRTHMILHNSRAHTFRTSIYAGTRDLVLNHASTSPALTWTVLCVEAYLQTFPYRSFVPESAAYMQNAIICLNNTFSRTSHFNDATIAAITHFTNFEVMYGNQPGAATHIKGLSTMIRLRGGLESLGMNGVLKRWVIWSDLIAATRFEISPCFRSTTLPAAAKISLSSFLPLSPIPTSIPSRPLIAVLAKANCLDLLRVFNNLHQLAFFLDATANLPEHKSNAILLESCYHERVSAAEYDLNILLQRYPENFVTNIKLARVFVLAGLLHIYSSLRLTRSAAGIRISIAGRLRRSLAALKEPPIELGNELIWIYILSALTCISDDRPWFLTRVKEQCKSLNLYTLEEVSTVLKRGVWLERQTWRAFETLWIDIHHNR